MKATTLLVTLLCGVAVLAVSSLDRPIVSQEMVDHINSVQSSWTASLDQGGMERITKAQARAFVGALEGGPKLPRKTYASSRIQNLPTNFDARQQWPQCDTIKQVRDQSACGSCWAFAAVEAISDRYCIFLKKTNLTISSDNLLACCDGCGYGCGGGFPSAAWQYWVQTGIVTEQCQPYPFPSCDHHIPGSKNPCPSTEYNTPNCNANTCNNGMTYSKDLHLGKNAYSLSGEQDILQEVYTNGPVEVAFTVYEDFLTYKSGVYQHTTGDAVGGHAVKIIGFGVEAGQKYWLVANSWNPHWGDKGFFKILRGVDECGIEDEADAGVPLY
jgi:cathepsin B